MIGAVKLNSTTSSLVKHSLQDDAVNLIVLFRKRLFIMNPSNPRESWNPFSRSKVFIRKHVMYCTKRSGLVSSFPNSVYPPDKPSNAFGRCIAGSVR